MNKPLKTTLIIIGSLLLLGIVGILFSDSFINKKVENFLKSGLPETVQIEYDDIEINSWNGSVMLVNPKITNFAKITKEVNSKVVMETLMIDDFGYWDYFFNDKIVVGSIQLRKPQLMYFHNKSIEKKNHKYSKLEQLKQDITVHRINIQEGQLEVYDLETDSLLMKTENFTANVMKVKMNPATVKRRIPFEFSDYNVHFDNLFYQLGLYENLTIASTKVTQQRADVDEIKIYTKYSKTELNQLISAERDHFDITIKSLALHDQDFGYHQDSIFYFKSPKVVFESPNMNLYRNKLIADDMQIKSLYSKMLRELTFDLTLSEVLVKNAAINYSEKVKSESSAGMIIFKKLNATITNLSNTYPADERTSLDIDAIFMNTTPINVNWYFDMNNLNDHFIFKAEIGKLPAEDLNKFATPNLNVKFEGELIKTYFTIDGNVNTSNVSLKANYDDFKVAVLEKDGKDKNRLLSAVANLFIKKSSEKESDNFREGSKFEIERDKTKSVFNFVWMNVSAGLLSALTGDGEK